MFSIAVVGWRKSKQNRNLLALGLLVTGVLAIAFISTEFYWQRGLWLLTAGAMNLPHKEDTVQLVRATTRHQRFSHIARQGVASHG